MGLTLDHAHEVAGGDAAVRREMQIHRFRLPQLQNQRIDYYCVCPVSCVCRVCRMFKYLVHDAEHLEGEQILSEVVAALEDDVDGLAQRIGVGEDDPQGCLRRVHRPALFHQNTVGHHPVAQAGIIGWLR